MDALLQEIQTEYEDIQKARLLMVQSDFIRASEIYSEVLSKMAEKEREDSLKMSVVYLEYSKCLFLSNDKLVINPELEEDNNYLEDLSIAWELLEIAKNTFRSHNFTNELIKVHILLSDIAQETNNFTDALEDLLTAFSLIKEQNSTDSRLPDIALRIAFAYEALDNKEMAIRTLESIIELISTETATKETSEIIEEVRQKIDEIKHPEKYKVDVKQVQSKIDSTQPVQKIKITKSEAPSKPSSKNTE
ncbi:hypothetical protein NEIG_01086 [Nematocida sp. ERTm5]|nr:hypothetical protein NEIG_01086 [Nematocida sp. ERTm5]